MAELEFYVESTKAASALLATHVAARRMTLCISAMIPTQERRTMPEVAQPNPLDKLPPPSFALLVATFGSQAMVALGQVPSPLDGKTEVRLDLAKHAIDTLAILQEKTKGNLTADESAMLEGVLHQLRMACVAASGKK